MRCGFQQLNCGSCSGRNKLSYKDDKYKWINRKDIIYIRIYKFYCGDAGPTPHKKMELEAEFFTPSNYPGNDLGNSPNHRRVHTEVARKMKRRPTSTTPSNIILTVIIFY